MAKKEKEVEKEEIKIEEKKPENVINKSGSPKVE
jgi:hypothetical protein